MNKTDGEREFEASDTVKFSIAIVIALIEFRIS